MKKFFPLITLGSLVTIILGIILFFILNQENNEEKTINYLETKYNQNFIIVSVNENISEKDIYSFNVSPQNNRDIVFSAGQKKQKNISPLLPPIDKKVFFDNYEEKTKEYIVSKILPNREINIKNTNDIEPLTTSIYSYMTQINKELSDAGFETTKFTCGIELDIIINEKPQKINFYILDKTKIQDLLYKAYYQ